MIKSRRICYQREPIKYCFPGVEKYHYQFINLLYAEKKIINTIRAFLMSFAATDLHSARCLLCIGTSSYHPYTTIPSLQQACNLTLLSTLPLHPLLPTLHDLSSNVYVISTDIMYMGRFKRWFPESTCDTYTMHVRCKKHCLMPAHVQDIGDDNTSIRGDNLQAQIMYWIFVTV